MQHIIVLGHYGCSAIQKAVVAPKTSQSPVLKWIKPVTDFYKVARRREIVKFRTYIDTLTLAQTQKEKIYAEREANGESRPGTMDGAAGCLPSDEVDGAKEAPPASRPISA